MSSLHKDPHGRSPYWFCAYRMANGQRTLRSTKETDLAKARIKCKCMQHIAEEAALPELDRRHLERVVREALRQLGHAPDPMVGAWLGEWLENERTVISEEMAQKYARVIRQFLACVGGSRSLRSIGSGDVARFRDQLLKQGLAPKTVNSRLISLKRIFRVAFESGAIDRNPVALVRSVKTETVSASTFTPEQVHTLVSAAEGDWKGLILAGFYTGARLMDLARLEWSNLTLEKDFIQFRQGKTGGKVQIPVHSELHLSADLIVR